MTLTVSLLRHAKSSWDTPGLDDSDRPLNARGRSAAPVIAQWMVESRVLPDHVLCSTAVRTRETLALVLPSLTPPPSVYFHDALYLAGAETILTMLRSTPDSAQHVLVVGHNPGFEDLAKTLCGGGDQSARDALAQKFPTCGLAVLSLDVPSWSKVAVGKAQLLHFVTPRALK